eukprot:gene12246-biopygen11582
MDVESARCFFSICVMSSLNWPFPLDLCYGSAQCFFANVSSQWFPSPHASIFFSPIFSSISSGVAAGAALRRGLLAAEAQYAAYRRRLCAMLRELSLTLDLPNP